MYLNDVHIVYYIIVAILGIIVGQFSDWMTHRAIEEKKIFTKDILVEYRKRFRPNFWSMGITAVIYLVILYIRGVSGNLFRKFNTYYLFYCYAYSYFNVSY